MCIRDSVETVRGLAQRDVAAELRGPVGYHHDPSNLRSGTGSAQGVLADRGDQLRVPLCRDRLGEPALRCGKRLHRHEQGPPHRLGRHRCADMTLWTLRSVSGLRDGSTNRPRSSLPMMRLSNDPLVTHEELAKKTRLRQVPQANARTEWTSS